MAKYGALKTAYATWHKGAVSLSALKKSTGLKIRELAPAFYVLGTPGEQKVLNVSKGLAKAKSPSAAPKKAPAKKLPKAAPASKATPAPEPATA